jgi:hypothetical protein
MTNELIELAERLEELAQNDYMVDDNYLSQGHHLLADAAMVRKVQEEVARMRMELIVMRKTLELGGSPMSVVGHITRLLGETDGERFNS